MRINGSDSDSAFWFDVSGLLKIACPAVTITAIQQDGFFLLQRSHGWLHPSSLCGVTCVFSVELILQQIWCHAQRFNTAPRGGIFHLVKLSLDFPTSSTPPASPFDSSDHISNATPNIPVIPGIVERLYGYGLGVLGVITQ